MKNAEITTPKLQVVAPDGGLCFGYGVDENGRASCYWEGAYCECRSPHEREIIGLQIFIREKEAEQRAWGLTANGIQILDRAKKRLSAAQQTSAGGES